MRDQSHLTSLTFGAVMAFSAICFAGDIKFSRDVLPILSDRCFHCHGPDESHREADLRLDLQEAATADRGGYFAISPNHPDKSELLARISTDDPDLLMPPADSHRKPLTQKEVEILRTWIQSGAEWGQHWSFEKPTRLEVPDGIHPVDYFVNRKLKVEALTPAPKAEPHTLLRRVAFDLTGLPPTKKQVQKFVSNPSTEQYAQFVDELLDSPHFGERMAMWWLDAARYSDTDGYQQDATRSNWPWRDWVIQAFNSNMPFDQFTMEQFAGDLLPEATDEQILATCFHRNHMTNGEGGRDPEESRVDYVIDRINTTGTVWLGLTLGCCQCHSHKFDPLSQHDYYSLAAFFNSIDEDGKAGGGAKPYLKYTSPFAQRAVEEAQQIVDARKPKLDAARQLAESEFETWVQQKISEVSDGFHPWHSLQATLLETVEGSQLQQVEDNIIQASGPNPVQDDYRIIASTHLQRVTGLKLEVFPHESHTDGKLSRGASGEFILTDVKLQVQTRGESQLRDIDIESAIADVEKEAKGRNYGKIKDTLDDDPRNGWTTETHDPLVPHTAVFALAEPLELATDEELVFVMLHRSTDGDANIGRFRVSVTDQPGPAVRSLDAMPLEALAEANVSEAKEIEGELRKRLLDQFLTDHVAYQQAKAHYDRANRQLSQAKNAAKAQNVMVLSEREQPRPSFVLERGVWDKHGDEVQRGMPKAILSWSPEVPNTNVEEQEEVSKQVMSRLHLAKWLVDRDNPLTARVIVNQLWQMCFGAGIVRTPEDFGLQGNLPTHPDLLDWLAVDFMESGWDLKHVLRLIVTSDTYQQSSDVTEELYERDPENNLLARGSRYRLPAWMIRDAALQSSGLLNTAIGGPPVMPYQPEGVWAEMFMGRFNYEPSQGPAQHRRTLYAFWRRSAAPTFLFDSSQRRVCEVRPRQTNTPLQALTLLNDLTQLEAAREIAKQSVQESGDVDERLVAIFKSILFRQPKANEMNVLKREYEKALAMYQDDPKSADELLQFGQPELRPTENQIDIAASMVIASMVFNLDEAISHE